VRDPPLRLLSEGEVLDHLWRANKSMARRAVRTMANVMGASEVGGGYGVGGEWQWVQEKGTGRERESMDYRFFPPQEGVCGRGSLGRGTRGLQGGGEGEGEGAIAKREGEGDGGGSASSKGIRRWKSMSESCGCLHLLPSAF
jgi:hypothetical protein